MTDHRWMAIALTCETGQRALISLKKDKPASKMLRSYLLATSEPSHAIAPVAECYTSRQDWGRVRVLDDGKISLELTGQTPLMCSVNSADFRAGALFCGHEEYSLLNFSALTPGSKDERELLVLWDHIWYRGCDYVRRSRPALNTHPLLFSSTR